MSHEQRAEELRQQGVAEMRANRFEAAMPLFDEALSLANGEELRELIVATKAGAMITLGLSGPEIQQLPQIVMRRRNLHNTFLAAYNLAGKFEAEKEFTRARFYTNIALAAAREADDTARTIDALVALGNTCVYDSQNEEAIESYLQALELLDSRPEEKFRRGAAMQNLGYCYLMEDRTVEGIACIHEAIGLLSISGAEGFLPESYVDLCYGYLEAGELELAREYGEKGLAGATETRQVRNAHYLLGEVAYKLGDTASAEMHFEHLAKFYPDFPHLKDLLLAIDLRGMVNLKL